jgi:protein-disulfide isomerase
VKQCIGSEDALNTLKRQAQEGIKAKISGTPSIFVNGKLLNGGQAIPILESVYRELKK